MGMTGNFLRVSKDELEGYIANSSKLEDRVYNDQKGDDKNLLDVGKSWEAIFFILTGKSIATADDADKPLCWILSGPQEIDPNQDMGYGPATYTTIEQTKEINNLLAKLSINDLLARYNGKLMNELDIYPRIWDNDKSNEYLMENLVNLKDFYNKAELDNQAIILFIS